MTDINHILVPTDGSEHSLKAARFAGDLARSTGASVTVLMVQDTRSIVVDAWNATAGGSDTGGDTGTVEAVKSAMESRATSEELADTSDAVGEVDGDTNAVQLWGHPADDICRYAERHDVDLIVMGSHGRSALKRAILGSVSHAVVNSATCAVMIVR
ncbi:MAG: universal stress protein [Pseudomonadota bacterium]